MAIVTTALAAGCAAEPANGRPWVHSMRLRDVHHASARAIKARLGVQATGILFSPKHYLEPTALALDRLRIEAYYRERGYFDARAGTPEVRPRKQPGSVDIEIAVEEGQPSRISQVAVTGAEDLLDVAKHIKRIVKLVRGQIFDHSIYLAEKNRLERLLHDHGYAWAEVAGDVQVDRGARTVDVHFSIVAGPKARFGRVIIEGAQRLRPLDIVRASGLIEGAWFEASLIDAARSSIYNEGIFSSVTVTYEHAPTDPAVADVRIVVTEGQFHELRLGGGVSIEAQRNDVHLMFGYTKRNFLGGLRRLQLRIEPGLVALPAVWSPERWGPAALTDITFVQPFLFGARALELKWVVGYDLGIDYAYQYHGPRTQIGITYALWRRRILLGISYNFQLLDFFNTDQQILGNPDLAGRLFGYTDPYRLGWWQEELSLDLRDRPLDPHRGAFLALTVEEGGAYAGGAFTYEKLVPDVRGYIPLGSRLTFAVRVKFGQIFSQGDLGSPITRRLYLGGPSSHRGFNFNRLSYQLPSASGGPSLPIGGDQMLLVQGELRIKIVKLFGNWFGATVFADGGDVTTPNCPGGSCPGLSPAALKTVELAQLHWAVGAGLRYKTVIGTLRAELGVRLNRLSGADPARTDQLPNPDPGSRFAFHLSVGEAF